MGLSASYNPELRVMLESKRKLCSKVRFARRFITPSTPPLSSSRGGRHRGTIEGLHFSKSGPCPLSIQTGD